MRPTNVELRQLHYAVALADHLHFGRAAQACQVSQSTVSQQIARLEKAIGVRLFDRTTRDTRLTAAGRAFAGHARLALDEAEFAVAAARSAEAAP